MPSEVFVAGAMVGALFGGLVGLFIGLLLAAASMPNEEENS